jgi:8-oxo-dGTP pyrophosphatase MutT (NUDIX family)
MIKDRDVANVVVLLPETREVLLQKKTFDYPSLHYEGGRWTIFGGAIELNENPEDAARRELKEELGMEGILKFSHNGSYYVPNKSEGNKHVYVYETDRDMKKYRIGEGAGIAIFAMLELKDIKIIECDQVDLKRVLEERKWLNH